RSHNADVRADLYSLGCTLFFLLTGRAPYPGRNATEKMYGHCFTEPPTLQSLRPDAPAALSALVRRLMAKTPAERCQTPAELADLLAHVPAAEATSPAITAEPPAPQASSGTAPPWVPLLETDASRPEPVPRRSRRRPLLWLAAAGAPLLALLIAVIASSGKQEP